MKFLGNKTKTIAIITIILMMTSVMLIEMPISPVKAQLAAQQPVAGPLPAGAVVNVTVDTVAALSFRPNPVGAGQPILVNFWTTPGLPSNNFYHQGYKVTITKPDGTTYVWTGNSEPATGANWFEYTPDQIGEWKLKFEFAGEWFPAGQYYNGKIVTNSSGERYGQRQGTFGGSSYYKPSSTGEQSLTVQQNWVYSWPDVPLPTDYWTRPGSINNRNWWPILGSYPGTGYVGGGSAWNQLYPDTNPTWAAERTFNPWIQAPNTAHVVWKRQGAVAGLIGGPAGQYGITSSPGTPSVIYSGRCYQTVTEANGTSATQCYDLRTGNIYYEIPGGVTPNLVAYYNPVPNTETIAGQEIGSQSWSVELLLISGSSLLKVNPYSGAVSNYSIAPLSGGTFYNQIGGYVYTVQTLGNATNPIYRLINWTTRGTSTTLASRIISNTTYARSSLPQYIDFNTDRAADVPNWYDPVLDIRYRINAQIFELSTGKLLYNITTGPEDTLYYIMAVADHGKIAIWENAGRWIAFDMLTGQVAWRSEGTDYPWSSTGFGAYSTASAYGMLFRFAYDHVYAFNWTNGKMVWKYTAYAPDIFETPYIDKNGSTVMSFDGGATIADGKMYIYNTEHTPTWPLTRGWSLHCINITTGEGLWKVNNPMTFGAIADGYMTAANAWDGYMYVFGKGQTATAVSAPDVSVPLGTAFTIKGSVLDMSAAQPGTACVSKGSMETQMEYLHLQMPIAGIWGNETITGVPVTLTAIASDGTVTDIGTTTTNGYFGTFAYAWTPPSMGTYQIAATFAGDDSYGTSSAATAVVVSSAPATPTPMPTPPQAAAAPDYTAMILGSTVAIIIAVAIATVLILRKRP